MPLRPILRLLLAGLLAGTALLAPWPGEGSYTPPLRVGYQVARADGPNDWPMFGHDPAHTRYNDQETALTPPLRLKWTYSTGLKWCSPVVVGNTAYVGCGNYGSGKILALDAITGALKWSYTPGDDANTPAVADGVVYVSSSDYKVYALDAATGAVRWSYTTGDHIGSSAAVADGTVYVGSNDNKVYALDASTGALKWSFATNGDVNSSPAVVGGVVYVGNNGGKVYALDAATGTLIWSYTATAGSVIASSPAVVGGVVYVGSTQFCCPVAGDSKMLALDASNGALKWSYQTGNITSSPAVVNGVVYVGSNDKKLYALDAVTGGLRWSYTTRGEVASSPAVANAVVYAGSVDKKLYALDAATGTLLWSYTTGGAIQTSPAVASGVVYVGSEDGKVYAFETDVGSSSVTILPTYQPSPSFTVSWSGTGSIASYDIQYKDGASGTWTDWITSTTALSSTFASGQDGHTYYFQSRARDSGGNVEVYPGGNGDTSTMVDLTAPTGSISINGGALYATSISATLNLSASDAASGPGQMSFSNDGTTFSDWEPYAASKAWALTAGDGLKTVYARFRDQAGNASATYSDTITLISAPTSGPILINGGALYTRVPTVTLSLSPPDLPNTSQMQFSDDGLSYASFEPFTTTRPYTLTAGDGLKEVWVRYKALTETVHSDTIILDTAPPTATVGSLAAYQTSASFPVAWSASDATSGPAAYDLQYRDGPTGTWANWIAATAALSSTFSGQDGRTYGFRARAADNAGNQADYPAEAQAQTTVDTTPPTGSLSAPAYVNSTAITLTLAATDTFGVAGMAFSSDGSAWGSWEPYSTTRPYTLASGDGQKTVYGKFRDNAGNYSSPYSATVTLDATPPGQPFPDDGVSGASRNPTPTFSWAPVTDNLSGVTGYSWRVDSGAETYITSSTVTLPTQADGEHTFSVRALDRAGNYGSYGSHLFTIKTAAPAPPDILQPQSPTAADRIIVSGAAPPNSKVKLYVNGAYFGVTNAGAYGIWNLVNVPIVMGENVLKATATVYELADWSYAVELISALSSPMVVMRVPVYYAPPADMASGVLTPSAGGTVTTTNNYMVIVPQGAFTQSVKVVLTPLAPQSAPTVFGIAGTDSYVALSAVTADTGEKVASFQEPVTVTLSYDPAKLTVPESTLAIHYYDEALGRWVALPSLVDTVNHTVSAQVTHFTVFGVLASLPWRTYLPAVSRGYGGGW